MVTTERPTVTRKCVTCGDRFYAPTGDTRCPEHAADHARNMAALAEKRRATNWRTGLAFAIHWRGYVVGMYRTDSGGVRPRAMLRSLSELPRKLGVIDLDGFNRAYDRAQIGALKGKVKDAHRLRRDPRRIDRVALPPMAWTGVACVPVCTACGSTFDVVGGLCAADRPE